MTKTPIAQAATPDFNGWTNEESWSTHLQITNDPKKLRYWHDQARAHLAKYQRDTAELQLADEIEASVVEKSEQSVETLDPILSALLINAIAKVNFQEIARQFIEDVQK